MAQPIAPDDIVASHREAAANERPPLLVIEPLREYLDAQGLGTGGLQIAPVGDGHSNVTYHLAREGLDCVLRRPPRPPLPPSAHDVLREARLLRALEPTAVRVPRVLAVGDDERVIGAPFYVMERMLGAVITTRVPGELDFPAERARIGEQLVDALAEVHAVDWREAGLEGFGKPSGYLERQLRRFLALWELNRTRELPEVGRVGGWLLDNLPASGPATIVHGDYRLGNTMFALGAPARLVAIFDWEMATIGDPLADVGYMCALWSQEGDRAPGALELTKVTRAPGFPSREQLIERYEQRSGRSMPNVRWYTALALWKSIVFMEGNYKRALSGTTDDPFLRRFGEGVAELARQAQEVALGGRQQSR